MPPVVLNAPISAQGEFAIKRFYGDPKLAVAYLPVAYKLLGGLKNQMALSDIGFGHRLYQLADGTKIRVIRNGEMNIVEITTTITYRSLLREEIREAFGGFVFYPKLDGVTAYKSGGANALMEIQWGGKNTFNFKIIAPATKDHGSQFAFYGLDVYSWGAGHGGDLPGAGSTGWNARRIYKNGRYLLTCPQQVLGVKPFLYKNEAEKIEEVRLLVAYGYEQVRIGCYTASLELLPKDILLYNKKQYSDTFYIEFWPVRFNSVGDEFVTIVKYATNTSPLTDYEDNYEIYTLYQVLSGSISISGDGISGEPEVKEELNYAPMQYTNTQRIAITGSHSDSYAPRDGCSSSVTDTHEFSGTALNEWSPVSANKTFSFPYVAVFIDDSIRIGHVEATVYKGSSSRFRSEQTGDWSYSFSQHLNELDHCILDYLEERGDSETHADTTIFESKKISYRFKFEDISFLVYEYEKTNTLEKIYLATEDYSLINYTTYNRTSIYTFTQRETNIEKAKYTNGIYFSANTGCVFYKTTSWTRTNNYSGQRDIQYISTEDSSTYTVEDNGSRKYTDTASADVNFYDKFGNSFSESLTRSMPDVDISGFEGFNDIPFIFVRDSNKDETTTHGPYSEQIPPIWDQFEEADVSFSHVLDERFADSPKDVWAYSFEIDHGLPHMYSNITEYRAECAFGPLANFLPVVNDDGIPQKEKLPGEKLTVSPIGLY